MNPFPVYVISLRDDKKSIKRRENIIKQFTPYSHNFIWVDAVDARKMPAYEYYYRLVESIREFNYLITPGEVCCTLSHIKALKQFLETDEDYAIIMEDDARGSTSELEKLFAIFPQLGPKAFLNAFLYTRCYQAIGKQTSWEGVYYIIPYVLCYVFGAVCYAITREIAKEILLVHNRKTLVADNWYGLFFKIDVQYFLAPYMGHPIQDKKQSILFVERRKRKNVFYTFNIKYFKWCKLFLTIYRKILVLLTCRLLNICGFTKLLPFNRIAEYERIRKRKE